MDDISLQFYTFPAESKINCKRRKCPWNDEAGFEGRVEALTHLSSEGWFQRNKESAWNVV
jgi:hypothetical protein